MSAGAGAAEEFTSCLAALVEGMSEQERSEALAGESISMERKLEAIAVDRERNRDLYREIEGVYSPNPANRGVRIPWLRAEHAVERYRLAWEYFLLEPHSARIEQAVDALARIANPVSVATLRYAYKKGLARCLVLPGLLGIPCRESADAISEILEEEGERGDPMSPEPWEWPPSTILVNRISGLSAAKRSTWRALMEEPASTSPAFERLSRGVQGRLSIDRAFELTYLVADRVAAEVKGAGLAGEQTDRAAEEFDAELSAAGKVLGSDKLISGLSPEWDWEPGGVKARLQEIAHDRARRRRVYDEILRTYVHSEKDSEAAPPVKPEHATERYRLVWEFVLLTPKRSDASRDCEDRAAHALGAIANPAASVTLRHAIEVNTKPEVPSTRRVVEKQRAFLDALLDMPSVMAGHAISSAWSDISRHRQWAASRSSGVPVWDPKMYVVEAVVSMPTKKRDAWLAATDDDWPNRGELRARLKAKPR